MTSAKVLIVDDAQQVRRVLRTALSAEGYTIFEAGTGEEALNLFRTSPPDVILLDVNMPGMTGLETCHEIRRYSDVPILMLTVRNAERDKVMALDAGADDYVLRQLVASAGKPLTHRRLLQTVWGPDYGDEPEYLRVMINQLRKKIEADPAKPKFILTEPWVGYRFQPPKEKPSDDKSKD